MNNDIFGKKKNDKKISKDVNKIDIKLYDFDAQN